MSTLTFPRPTPKPRKEPSKIVVHGNRAIKIVRTVTIMKPARELYTFWRNPVNLQSILDPEVTVTPISETEWRWQFAIPARKTKTWETLVINDHPGSLIAWRSREGSGIPNAGSIRFKPSDKGTRVTLKVEYEPPKGKFFTWLAGITKETPAHRVTECLQRFKTFIESPPLAVQPKETKVRERRKREV